MTNYTVVEVENIKVTVDYDENAESPRTYYDNHVGVIVAWHRVYNLGDVNVDDDDFNTKTDILKKVSQGESILSLPVYIYEQSGIIMGIATFEFKQGSIQIGWIFTTKEKIRQSYEVKRVTKNMLERAREDMIAEIEDFNSFVSGDVFTYTVQDVLKNETLDYRSNIYSLSSVKRNILHKNNRLKTLVDMIK